MISNIHGVMVKMTSKDFILRIESCEVLTTNTADIRAAGTMNDINDSDSGSSF